MSFSDTVDATLAAARQLLGDGGGPDDLPPAPQGEQLSVPPSWAGPAADRATATTTQLDARRTELAQQHAAARPVIAEAAAISRDARRALDAVDSSWAQEKAVLGASRALPTARALCCRPVRRGSTRRTALCVTPPPGLRPRRNDYRPLPAAANPGKVRPPARICDPRLNLLAFKSRLPKRDS